MQLLQETKCPPLFQLYSLLTRALPLGLNGPFSENAPTPTDEHPGPTQAQMHKHHQNSYPITERQRNLGSYGVVVILILAKPMNC